MALITDIQRAQMLVNGERSLRDEAHDPIPVVKLFTPDGNCTWLLTELNPEFPNIAFGLIDLGFGCPEYGSVRLCEVEAVRGKLGLPVERDYGFVAGKPISFYAKRASAVGRIET
jgi:hypothetical protein